MRISTIIAAAVATITVPAIAKPVTERSAGAILTAERAFAARHQQVSVRQAFLEYLAPDGVALTPDGTKNVKDFWTARPDRNNPGYIQWWPIFAGIARSGDLGFTTGPGIFGGDQAYTHYFTIWKKQPDGAWKWVIDFGCEGDRPSGGPADSVHIVPASAVKAMRPDAAWKELLAIDTALGQRTGRAATALLPSLAPEAQLLGRGTKRAIGSTAAADVLAKGPAQYVANPQGGGVSAGGDLGWTYGYAIWSDGGVQKKGAYLRAWQRRRSGWVILVDNTAGF